MLVRERKDEGGIEPTLWSAFSDLAARMSEDDAILAPGRDPLTFGGLRKRIAAAKEDLNRLGIGRGDRVAIALPNGPDMAVCLLSAIACTIAAPLNPASTGDEFRQYLRRIRPKALIIPAASETPAREVAHELDVWTIELSADVSAPSGTFTLTGSPAACGDPNWNTGGDTGVILLTSGTTSGQKLVPVKPRHQVAYAWGINETFGLGSGDRSFLVMPLFHASGLNSSLLVPLLNGAAVVCLAEFDVSSFFRHMDAFRPTWITAGYTFLKAILGGVDAHRDIVQRSRIRFIRSGTGRLDPEVKCELERAFGAPVIEQYSTSETGVIACWPMPPDQGKPGSVGRPLVNEVAIMGSDGAFLRQDEEGEIVVRGPSVFDGYLDDFEANKTAFFFDEWYRTGDLGRLDADGFLTITGRAKEVINRGGEKISPREVETVMASHAAIRDIKVFGIPHPSLGEEVVAAVILRHGASASEADLKVFAGECLADFKVPRRFFFRDAFPLGASKKLDIRTLVRECEQVLEAERASPSFAPARQLSGTEEVICGLWRTVLAADRVGPDDNFFLLGGDSLKALELLVAIERAFGVELSVDSINSTATASIMAAEIDRLRARAGSNWKDRREHLPGIPEWQQTIRDRCHHDNGTFVAFTKADLEQSIPDRFEQMVRMYPNQLAIKTSDHQLTYEELNRAANRLARTILDLRGQTSEPVASLIGNVALALIAFLGILKSGKFYVPLDPLFPDTRTAYMLDDCQAGLLVTTSEHLSLAYHLAQDGLQVLNSSELAPDCPSANLGLSIPADSLAYLLYTSGSSGRPKGVTENHRNLLHEVMRLTNDFHICPEDRITLLNSLGFSGAARSIYGSLLNGAGLFPYDIRERGLAKLASWMINEAITIYRSGPTLFRQFAQTLTGQEQFPALRLVAMGGEAALKRDVDLYKKHFSADCVLVNGLRITETGTVRHYFVDKTTEISEATVPVGYPVQDMTILLVDANGREVLRNEIGEIAVRSRYLSPGYWRRPMLTQARFLPGRTGEEERTYLTGDVGIMQTDGRLMHLGRMDLQIKIRDQRVDPAEIEEALLTLDTVQAAVVEARHGESAQPSLVAYVVLQPHAAPTTSALRRALSERLPEYMIPSRYVVLDALPLTPTGKVDRRALPESGAARPTLDSPCVMPRTPVEKKLAELWADLLGFGAVGVHDSFLDLGGDSLKAVELHVLIGREFGVELPVDAMYGDAATVSKLAAIIDQRLAGPSRDEGDARADTSADGAPAARSYRHARAGFRFEDLVSVLTFLGLTPMAWFLPRKAWPAVCATLARAHVVLRGLPAKDLEEALRRLDVQATSEEVQRRLLSGIYEDVMMTLREHLPVDWRPAIRLLGAEHIGAARAAGRGAVLWSCPSPFGGLISKKALKAAGVEIVSLRSSIHPYSGTVFGMRILNPVRTTIEDRYLGGTVTFEDSEGLSALQELRRHLMANTVITIAANGSEGAPFEMPFLEGTLKLSLGAPTLAALHGAPLLPVFTTADGAGGFEVIVGPPIEAESHGYAGETARALARTYAALLEAHLRCHPAEWRGWFMRHTWSSDKCLN